MSELERRFIQGHVPELNQLQKEYVIHTPFTPQSEALYFVRHSMHFQDNGATGFHSVEIPVVFEFAHFHCSIQNSRRHQSLQVMVCDYNNGSNAKFLRVIRTELRQISFTELVGLTYLNIRNSSLLGCYFSMKAI